MKAAKISPMRPRAHQTSCGRKERAASKPQAKRKSSVPEPRPNTFVASSVSANPIAGVAARAKSGARRAKKGTAA